MKQLAHGATQSPLRKEREEVRRESSVPEVVLPAPKQGMLPAHRSRGGEDFTAHHGVWQEYSRMPSLC